MIMTGWEAVFISGNKICNDKSHRTEKITITGKYKLYQRILQAARTRFSLRHAVKTKYRKASERVFFSCPKEGDTLGVFNTVAGWFRRDKVTASPIIDLIRASSGHDAPSSIWTPCFPSSNRCTRNLAVAAELAKCTRPRV